MADLKLGTTAGGYLVIHTNNFNSYAPKLDGTGATGTWGISISGNAVTATSSTSAGYVVNTVTGTNTIEIVRVNMADNDYFRILVGGTASNAGYAEIATADDGNEPIHVRQYTGNFASLVRTLTLLDSNGNTIIPGHTYSSGTQYVTIGSGTDRLFFSGTGAVNSYTVYENSTDVYVNSYRSMTLRVNQLGGNGGGLYISGGITYFNNSESVNLYGIRGRYTNEYIHLYNKVGIGGPDGWGTHEADTPQFGLSTYGGANLAYNQGVVNINNTTNSTYTLYVVGGTSGSYFRGGDTGTGSSIVRFNMQNDNPALYVRGDGNTGLKTLAPSETLSLIGNIAFGTTEGKAKMTYNSTENSIDFIIN